MNVLENVLQGTEYLSKCAAVKEFCLVGSAIYHPEPKDVDFLVYIEQTPDPDLGYDALAARFLLDGPYWYTLANEYDDQTGQWCALRSSTFKDINLILTVDKGWYDRAKLANEVCHALKLMDKGDRVVVYRVVRDGDNAEMANTKRDGSR